MQRLYQLVILLIAYAEIPGTLADGPVVVDIVFHGYDCQVVRQSNYNSLYFLCINVSWLRSFAVLVSSTFTSSRLCRSPRVAQVDGLLPSPDAPVVEAIIDLRQFVGLLPVL